MTPEEAQLLRQVEETYAQLDSWFHRTSTEAEQPQKGSELHADDQPYPHAPISEMARMSLAIGTEHLRMVRIVTDKRQIFPTATFTTLRGALVGAAQAFWVLSDDDSEVRRSRGWTVLAEQLRELGKFYGEVNRIDPGTVDAEPSRVSCRLHVGGGHRVVDRWCGAQGRAPGRVLIGRGAR